MNTVEKNPSDEPRADAEIDLVALISTIWQRKRPVAICMMIGTMLSLLYLHTVTYKYTAQLQVTPVQATAAGGAGALGGLRGLASIAGINLPGDSANIAFQLYTESLTSRVVAEEIVVKHPELLHEIFASEWDPANRKWKAPPRSFGWAKDAVKRVLGLPLRQWSTPNAARLQQYIEGTINVVQNPKTPVVTISMDHGNRDFAVRFLSALHAVADERLRHNALDRTTHYIDYLTEKLASTTVAEHRLAIAQALSEQEKQRMMTSATTSFAAEPFGRPSASAWPTTPQPFLIILFGIIFGLFVGIAVAIFTDMRSPARV